MNPATLDELRTFSMMLSLLLGAVGLLTFFVKAARFFDRLSLDFGGTKDRLLGALEDSRSAHVALVKTSERQALALEASAKQAQVMESMAEERREIGISMRAMSRKLNEVLDAKSFVTNDTLDVRIEQLKEEIRGRQLGK